MPPVLLIIAAIIAFLMLLGAGIAIIASPRQASVEERIEQFVSNATIIELPEEEEQERKGPDFADKLDKLLSGQSFFGPIRTKIAKADVKLRVSEYITLVVLSAIAFAGLGYLIFGGQIIFAVIGFLIGFQLPGRYINLAAARRIHAFDNQLADTLNLWVNALRSGYSVLQAMETIAVELPPPVSREFERVVQEVRLGLTLDQALANMYRRVPSDDLDLVITAVNIQREVGGNLAEVLDTISFTIRERVRIKGEIRTLTAQGRISGWIVSLLPIGLGLILYRINPEYVSELWVDKAPYLLPGESFPCGWLVLGIGAFMIGTGIMAVRRIVDIEV